MVRKSRTLWNMERTISMRLQRKLYNWEIEKALWLRNSKCGQLEMGFAQEKLLKAPPFPPPPQRFPWIIKNPLWKLHKRVLQLWCGLSNCRAGCCGFGHIYRIIHLWVLFMQNLVIIHGYGAAWHGARRYKMLTFYPGGELPSLFIKSHPLWHNTSCALVMVIGWQHSQNPFIYIYIYQMCAACLQHVRNRNTIYNEQELTFHEVGKYV
jgi:hypothetical protein